MEFMEFTVWLPNGGHQLVTAGTQYIIITENPDDQSLSAEKHKLTGFETDHIGDNLMLLVADDVRYHQSKKIEMRNVISIVPVRR